MARCHRIMVLTPVAQVCVMSVRRSVSLVTSDVPERHGTATLPSHPSREKIDLHPPHLQLFI